jgi:hypothetical protein
LPVGLDGVATVEVNFGQQPFQFGKLSPFTALAGEEAAQENLEAERYVTHITTDKVRVPCCSLNVVLGVLLDQAIVELTPLRLVRG